MKLAVPAKVNLHLQVLGRRPDGFHELRTLFQAVDLYDELTAEPAAAGRLSLEVEPVHAVSSGDENLVLQAARALVAEVGAGGQHGAHLRLVKRIPVAAGLGGGSADAAGALVLLDRLWQTRLGRDRLHALARRLGSDVPYFFHGGLALGVGRGEEVYPLPDLDELGVIVASSACRVSTTEVYGELAPRAEWDEPEGGVYFMAVEGTAPCWSRMRNDLELVVCSRWPEIARVRERLAATGPLRAAVTGSGSAVFAVYASVEAARQAAGGLRDLPFVHVGRSVSRARSCLPGFGCGSGG